VPKVGGAQRTDRNALDPRHQVPDIAPAVKYFTDAFDQMVEIFKAGPLTKSQMRPTVAVLRKPTVELCK
jgi:hypothetical protein